MRTEEFVDGPNDHEPPMIEEQTLLIPYEILADGSNTRRDHADIGLGNQPESIAVCGESLD